MEMPKPNEHHVKLKKLVGSWRGSEIMHPSQWKPDRGEAIGKSDVALALGGFAIISNYEQKTDNAVTFSGHGVWTYDQEKNQVVLHWFDCFGSPPEVFRGGWEGDILIVAHGGPGMYARLTHDYSQEGHLETKMEMSSEGKAWKTFFTGSYDLI